MKKKLTAIFVACLISAPVLAAPACYSPQELRAEELLRLHSELMVITVTCRTDSYGGNLVPVYTAFTRQNIAALHDAEQTMIRYYAAHGRGNGVAQLDSLRTKLGNEFGQHIADVSAPKWCAAERDKVATYYMESPTQLDNDVTAMAEKVKPYAPPCKIGTVIASRSGK